MTIDTSIGNPTLKPWKYTSQQTRKRSVGKLSKLDDSIARKTHSKRPCRFGKSASADGKEILAAVDKAEASLARDEGRRITTREELTQLADDIKRRGVARLSAEQNPC